MDDQQIVDLYWRRDETAITVTQDKYGPYCRRAAANILPDSQGAEECVNDTWLGAWNAMPPHRPFHLPAFLGRITRNLAVDTLRSLGAKKKGGGYSGLSGPAVVGSAVQSSGDGAGRSGGESGRAKYRREYLG